MMKKLLFTFLSIWSINICNAQVNPYPYDFPDNCVYVGEDKLVCNWANTQVSTNISYTHRNWPKTYSITTLNSTKIFDVYETNITSPFLLKDLNIKLPNGSCNKITQEESINGCWLHLVDINNLENGWSLDKIYFNDEMIFIGHLQIAISEDSTIIIKFNGDIISDVINAKNDTQEGEVAYYNIHGVKYDHPIYPGVWIKKSKTKTTKILVE